MNYVYIRSEPGLWTVGHYDQSEKWHAESDHDDPEAAAKRVCYLNGGTESGSNALRIERDQAVGAATELRAQLKHTRAELDTLTRSNEQAHARFQVLAAKWQGEIKDHLSDETGGEVGLALTAAHTGKLACLRELQAALEAS